MKSSVNKAFTIEHELRIIAQAGQCRCGELSGSDFSAFKLPYSTCSTGAAIGYGPISIATFDPDRSMCGRR